MQPPKTEQSTQHQMQMDKQRIHYSGQFRVINEILSDSISTSGIDALLRKAALRISQSFGYRVTIGLIEQDSLIFKAIVSYDFKLQSEPITISLGQGITGTVAITGKPMIIADVASDPRYYGSDPETRSELAVPLITTKDHVIGVLNVERRDLGAFSSEDLQAFRAIAASLTLALENARRLEELTVLHQVATAVSRAQNLDQMLLSVVETVVNFFATSASALYLASPDSQRLILFCHSGLPEAIVKRGQRLKVGQSIAGRVFQLGKPIFVQDVTLDPRSDGIITSEDGLRSAAYVPLKTDKGVLGVLGILSKNARLFTEHDVDLLQTIGHNISVAIEKAQAESRYRLLYQSARDPIIVTDLNRIILDANQEAFRLLGYTHAELLGMDLLKLIANDSMATQALECFSLLNRGEVSPVIELEVRHKNNFTFFVEANLTPIVDHTGQVSFLQAIWRDITERKQSEAVMLHRNRQLNALLEISRAAFRSFERDDLVSQVATGVLPLLESDICYVYFLTDNPELLKSLVFHHDTFDQGGASSLVLGEGIIREVVSTGLGQIANNVHLTKGVKHVPHTLDNTHYNLLSVPMKSQERILGVISVARVGDQAENLYTQRDYEYLESFANLLTLELEYMRLAEVQHKQRAAEMVLEQMSLVGALLGHKFGGFLGALALTVQELRRQVQPTNPSTAELMDNLLLSSRTASRIINQFRSMAKPLSQQKDIVLLEPLIRTALQQTAIPAHVQVIVENLDLPSVKASGPLLVEVFEGLIRNALEAMPKAGTLSIRGGTTLDRYEVWLQFSDTGHGMQQQTLQNLFTPFFTTKRDSSGIGVGLWLSRLYLQTLGGDIEVTSKLYWGSTFTIRLPAVQDVIPRADSTIILTER